MPRGKRGGAREGEPGKAYSNRTDLNQNRQPVMAASGQPYGARQAQEAAQEAIPLPAAPPVSAPVPPRPQGPAPGSLGAFNRPTEYPDEPLTAGLDMGLGPGKMALSRGVQVTPDANLVAQLRALYVKYPNSDIGRLLSAAQAKADSEMGF